MQTRRKNKQKATAPTDEEQLKSLKDQLHVPHFWLHVTWSSWSITNYDRVATRKIMGLRKCRAHEFLKEDLSDVLGVLDPAGRRFRRAKQMEIDLRKIGKDGYNLEFWRLYAKSNTLSPLEHDYAEIQFSTATLNRAANILNKGVKCTFSEANLQEEA